MRILSNENNDRFFIEHNHLFYQNYECMAYIGDNQHKEYWETDKVRMYKTGALFTEYYGYQKVSRMAFFGNDGRRLFSINTDNLPFDVNLYKSKADNINAIVFDNGVLVSMQNLDNQSKFMFYFYDKTFITGYDLKQTLAKVQALSNSNEYTDMVLNQLENDLDDYSQNI